MDIAVVIPTYNERDNIKKLVPEIFAVLNEKGINGRVIVVDDNSPDGTAAAVKKLSKKFGVELIEREKKLGIGSAYVAGFGKALGQHPDIIIGIDADGSESPEKIPELLEKARQFDIVVGSRYAKGGKIISYPFSRKLLSKGANFLAKHLLGTGTNDNTCAFRAYRGKAIGEILQQKINSEGYSFFVELLFLARQKKFSIAEIPITLVDRQHGKSKLGSMEIPRFFFTLARLFLNRFKD